MDDLQRPTVSIVIPTYNHARYLGRALQSVIDQTYTNWTAIIIDNHSTDETAHVIAKFYDPRISTLKINNYGVIAASRNLGIKESKGEWIAFLDSDDWWTPDKLSICCAQLREEIDFVYHDAKIKRSGISIFRRQHLRSRKLIEPALIDLLTSGNIICNSTVLVRRSILQKINGISEDSTMITSEDYNCWLRVAQITKGLLHIPKTLAYYSIHESNTSFRNGYPSWMASIEEFMPILNQCQKQILMSKARYLNGRYKFSEGLYEEALDEFAICLGRPKDLLAFRVIIFSFLSKLLIYTNTKVLSFFSKRKDDIDTN